MPTRPRLTPICLQKSNRVDIQESDKRQYLVDPLARNAILRASAARAGKDETVTRSVELVCVPASSDKLYDYSRGIGGTVSTSHWAFRIGERYFELYLDKGIKPNQVRWISSTWRPKLSKQIFHSQRLGDTCLDDQEILDLGVCHLERIFGIGMDTYEALDRNCQDLAHSVLIDLLPDTDLDQLRESGYWHTAYLLQLPGTATMSGLRWYFSGRIRIMMFFPTFM